MTGHELDSEYALEAYGYAICPLCNGEHHEEDFDGPICKWCAAKEGDQL